MYMKDKTDTFKFRVSPLFLQALEVKSKQMNCSKSACIQKLLTPFLADIMCEIRKAQKDENEKTDFYN